MAVSNPFFCVTTLTNATTRVTADIIIRVIILLIRFSPPKITVVVSPSLIETKRTASGKEELKNHFKNISPLKRLGKSVDVAKVIVHYCSDEVEYVTGVNTLVSGGIYME